MRRFAVSLVLVAVASTVSAADVYKLPSGKVELQSAGPLAFGPDGILLIGDTKAATLYAVQTGDKSGQPSAAQYEIPNFPAVLAKKLGVDATTVQINDLAVNPASGNLYIAVKVAGKSQIVRLTTAGEMAPLSLDNVPFSKAVLPNPPEDKTTGNPPRQRNNRDSSITDIAWVDGQVIISGMSNAQASSTVRSLSFPFSDASDGANLEIYHAAHGKSENFSAVRTFVPFNINGEATVLAGFVCTPLVKFPVAELTGHDKIKGTTVAELGNMNVPLDMIAYKQNGKDFLLLANNARGVMKISTENIDRKDGLTEPVRNGGVAGQTYETIAALQGTVQLDRLNDTHAIVLQTTDAGTTLKSVPLP